VLREADLIEKMASSSREAVIAEYKQTVEAELRKEAEDQRPPPPGRLARMFGATQREAPSIDQRVLDRRVEGFTWKVDQAEKRMAALDEALAIMPRHVTGGLKVGSIYGNPALQSRDGQRALVAKVSAMAALLKDRHSAGLERIERVLQARITNQIKNDKAAFEAHLASATPLELHGEAVGLIQDIRNGSTEEQRRTAVVHANGVADSVGNGTSESRRQVSLGHRTLQSSFSTRTNSASTEHTGWSSASEQLVDGADYTLRLASAKVPLVIDHWDHAVKLEERTTLPVEARLVLEKAVRVSEIYGTLVKRDPDLAKNLEPWVTGSQFRILEPSQVLENNRVAKVRDIKWNDGGTLQMSRIKADLVNAGPRTFLDAERVRMLRAELESRLTSDLR
jgi:hypothetical protein